MSEEFDRTKFLLNIIRQFLAALYWMATDLRRVRNYLLPSEEGSSLWKMIGDLQLFTESAEECCRKIRSRTPADSKLSVLQYPNEVCDRLSEAITQLNKAAMIVHSSCASASSMVTLLPGKSDY